MPTFKVEKTGRRRFVSLILDVNKVQKAIVVAVPVYLPKEATM